MIELADGDVLKEWTPEERREDSCRIAGMNPQARDLCDYLFGPAVAGSETRLREFLIYGALSLPTHAFWPAFLETWPSCDITWPYKALLLSVLRKHHRLQSCRAYLQQENARFFDDLPPKVKVSRGCARYRVRGTAWTVNEAIAIKFARGVRFDVEPDRVIATAVIPKEHIFAVFTDREEAEIVLDPRRLRNLRIESFAA